MRPYLQCAYLGLCLSLAPAAAAAPAPAPARPLAIPASARAAAGASTTPTVSYSRHFAASAPSYIEISVNQRGQARFGMREKDADPLATIAFTASAAAVRQIFQLSAKLHDFARPRLQSKQRVAYTGDKTFAYTAGAIHQAQRFTYTTVQPASELSGYFEQIAQSGVDAVRLERAMRFGRLDVLGLMQQIREEWKSNQLAQPQLLEPVLARAAADPDLMEAARRTAASLDRSMRGAPAP